MAVTVVGCGLGAWFDSRRRQRGRARRSIEHRQTTPIAGLREGEQAKIRGVVAAREALVRSPISGAACVGYSFMIDDWRHNPDQFWDGLLSAENWPSFLVRDETGSVAVLGPVKMLLDPCDSGENLPASAYDLLRESDVRMKEIFNVDRRFVFQETLLKVGDRVSVVGRPAREIDPAGRGSFREPPRLFIMRGSEKEPVIVIDDDESVAD
jgi:hypothetical protein